MGKPSSMTHECAFAISSVSSGSLENIRHMRKSGGTHRLGVVSKPTANIRPLHSRLSIHSQLSSSFDVPSVVSLSDTVKEFEPQADWTAVATFVSIMVVFGLLVKRTAAVEQAVMEREAALSVVRRLKSQSLEGSDSTSALQDALGRYEVAVRKEEQLRNIVPGVVRIVPPSAGSAAEESARDAAKQFLGKDYDIGIPKREDNPSGRLPFLALGVLVVLGMSLTGLLFLLSVDPMSTSSFLNNL